MKLGTLNTERLKPLKTASLKSPFGVASAPVTRRAAIGLSGERQFVRRAIRREYHNQLKAKSAREALGRLPEPGESSHVVMRGNFDSWDLVPAVLASSTPATIKRLDVATLGFNERVVAGLAAMFDAGQLEHVRFIAASWFRSVKDGGKLFQHLAEMLAAHNQPPPVAVRNHAKVICFELSDGRHFAVESSANLRSCNNAEIFCITQGCELVAFHRDWMTQIGAFAAQHPTEAPAREHKQK